MGNGFEGFLFLLLILFWIMEAISSARKRRGKGEAEEAPPGMPEGVEFPVPQPGERTGRRVNREAERAVERGERFPDRAHPRERQALPERGGRETPRAAGRRATPPASEGGTGAMPEERASGMLPRDLWEELAALARGEVPGTRKRENLPPVPAPEEGPLPEEVRSREARARVPRSREGYGARARREVPGGVAPVPAGGRSAGGASSGGDTVSAAGAGMPAPGGSRAFRSVFGGTGPADLRRAVILREVLGPPLALRDSPGPDLS